MWYPLLFKDPNFCAKVQERWTVIYPQLLGVVAEVDRLSERNRLSEQFNSVMWPLDSKVKVDFGCAYNGDENMTFDQAVATLKQSYLDRLSWMDNAIRSGNFVKDAE